MKTKHSATYKHMVLTIYGLLWHCKLSVPKLSNRKTVLLYTWSLICFCVASGIMAMQRGKLCSAL